MSEPSHLTRLPGGRGGLRGPGAAHTPPAPGCLLFPLATRLDAPNLGVGSWSFRAPPGGRTRLSRPALITARQGPCPSSEPARSAGRRGQRGEAAVTGSEGRGHHAVSRHLSGAPRGGGGESRGQWASRGRRSAGGRAGSAGPARDRGAPGPVSAPNAAGPGLGQGSGGV